MNTPESLNVLVSDLIHRGLPADYAERAVAELDDHHRDLVEEFKATGCSNSQAMAAASERLGDSRKLVAKTVREYQKRFWCARWPLLTFVIAPIPVLIATWFAVANVFWWIVAAATKLGLTGTNDADVAFSAMPRAIKFSFLFATFIIVPGLVMYAFARLGKRAAVGGRWFIVVACLLGIFAGVFRWQSADSTYRPILRNSVTGQVIEQPKPDFILTVWLPINAHEFSWPVIRRTFFSDLRQPCQLLLPFAIAAAFLWRRQHATHAAERFANYC